MYLFSNNMIQSIKQSTLKRDALRLAREDEEIVLSFKLGISAGIILGIIVGLALKRA